MQNSILIEKRCRVARVGGRCSPSTAENHSVRGHSAGARSKGMDDEAEATMSLPRTRRPTPERIQRLHANRQQVRGPNARHGGIGLGRLHAARAARRSAWPLFSGNSVFGEAHAAGQGNGRHVDQAARAPAAGDSPEKERPKHALPCEAPGVKVYGNTERYEGMRLYANTERGCTQIRNRTRTILTRAADSTPRTRTGHRFASRRTLRHRAIMQRQPAWSWR